MSGTNWEELMSAYLDDELSANERAWAEELLANDPKARQALESFAAQRRLFQQLPRPRMSTAATQRVIAAVAEAGTSNPRQAAAVSRAAGRSLPSTSTSLAAKLARANWRPATLFAVSIAALVLVGFIWLRSRTVNVPRLGHTEDNLSLPADIERDAPRDSEESLTPREPEKAAELSGGFAMKGNAPEVQPRAPSRSGTDSLSSQPKDLDGSNDAEELQSDQVGQGLMAGVRNAAQGWNLGADNIVAHGQLAQGGLGGGGLEGFGSGKNGLVPDVVPPSAMMAEGQLVSQEAMPIDTAGEPEVVEVDQVVFVDVPHGGEALANLKAILSKHQLTQEGFSIDDLASGQVEILYIKTNARTMSRIIGDVSQTTDIVLFDPVSSPEEAERAAPGAVPTIPQHFRFPLAQILNRQEGRWNQSPRKVQESGLGYFASPETKSDSTAMSPTDDVVVVGRSQVVGNVADEPSPQLQGVFGKASDQKDELEIREWFQSLASHSHHFFALGPTQGRSVENLTQRLESQLSRLPNEEAIRGADREQRQASDLGDHEGTKSVRQGRYLVLFGRDLTLEKYIQPRDAAPLSSVKDEK